MIHENPTVVPQARKEESKEGIVMINTCSLPRQGPKWFFLHFEHRLTDGKNDNVLEDAQAQVLAFADIRILVYTRARIQGLLETVSDHGLCRICK